MAKSKDKLRRNLGKMYLLQKTKLPLKLILVMESGVAYAVYVYIVCTPPPFLLVGWTSCQIFKKGSLIGLQLWEGVAGKEGGNLFQGGYNFYEKNKLKSEIFNEKKVCKQKYFSLS